MSFTLGSATYTFLWELSIEAALDRLAEYGFEWVEIAATPPHCLPSTLTPDDRRRLRQQLQRLGLRVAALNPTFTDINLASTNPGMREESILQVKETIDLAGDLNAWAVILSFGRRNPLMPAPFDYAWQLSRAAIDECLEVADRRGITLLMENNPSNFIRTSDECLEAARYFSSPRLKLVVDVANASLVEDPACALERTRDWLGYVHLSDTNVHSHAHMAVGAGQIDFLSIAHALQKINYQGLSVLETTDPHSPAGSILRSVDTLVPLGWRLRREPESRHTPERS